MNDRDRPFSRSSSATQAAPRRTPRASWHRRRRRRDRRAACRCSPPAATTTTTRRPPRRRRRRPRPRPRVDRRRRAQLRAEPRISRGAVLQLCGVRRGLAATSLDRHRHAGAVATVHRAGAAQVDLHRPGRRAYAREIAYDEIAHVTFLRTALGTAAVAQPGDQHRRRRRAAPSPRRRARPGVVGATGHVRSLCQRRTTSCSARIIFEDVGVTAYKGASPLITNKTYLEAAAGILAAEAYHAGLVRTVLYPTRHRRRRR